MWAEISNGQAKSRSLNDVKVRVSYKNKNAVRDREWVIFYVTLCVGDRDLINQETLNCYMWTTMSWLTGNHVCHGEALTLDHDTLNHAWPCLIVLQISIMIASETKFMNRDGAWSWNFTHVPISSRNSISVIGRKSKFISAQNISVHFCKLRKKY